MSLLGLDMGSSACKAVLFSEDGKLLGCASREYFTYSPNPGWMEIDPGHMWIAAVEAIKEVASKVADPVKALSISSHGETIVPVDASGKAIGPGLMNADSRAKDQVEFLDKKLGKKKLFGITGCVLHPMYSIGKIMWLKDNNRELYDKTSKFLSAADFILAQMGVEPYIDYSLAARFMAFDVVKLEWSDEIISTTGLDKTKFPVAKQAGTIAGKLSAEIAEKLGLPEGTIVAVGGHDQPCGALGAGVIDTGDTADSAGTFECLTIASDEPFLTDEALSYNINTYCHVVPNRYVTLAYFGAGIIVRWFRDQFAQQEVEISKQTGEDPYDQLISHLTDEPSGVCITPHFVGSGNPSWNPNATGVIFGLRTDRTRYHMFQGILEGISCELKVNVDLLQKLIGNIDVLRTTGGGAKSPYWLQLRADIIGKKVATLENSEAVGLGAAILAGVAAGVYSDPQEGAKIAQFAKIYEPNPERAAKYSEQIAQYEKIYPALAGSGVY